MTGPTLPERMRAAADTIDEANTRIGGPVNGHWRPSELRAEADQVDAEDREAAEKADQVALLARAIHDTTTALIGARVPFPDEFGPTPPLEDCGPVVREHYQAIAAGLIENGWRKDGAA